jgi:hypothetical protein
MTVIKYQENWWESAAITIPKLPAYAAQHGCDFNDEEALACLAKKDHMRLYDMFNGLWHDLPNNVSIRHQPFFDLCDLCSEYWVFEQ